MTLKEASKRFCINENKLKYYEQSGLFDCHKKADGNIDYCDETLEYVSLIEILLGAGLDIVTLKRYLGGLGDERLTNEEQIKILMNQRYILLDDIHEKQKLLDKLDFIIREAKKKK